MRPLLKVEEVAEILEWSSRKTLRWLREHERLEPGLMVHTDGELRYYVKASALRSLLGLPDPDLEARLLRLELGIAELARNVRALQHDRLSQRSSEDHPQPSEAFFTRS